MKLSVAVVGMLLVGVQIGNAEINEFGFDPASFVTPAQLQLRVTPIIARDIQSGFFSYEYRIENLSGSRQKMEGLSIEVGDSLVAAGGTIDFDQIKSDKLGWTSGGVTTPHQRKRLPQNFKGSVDWSVDRIELAGRVASEDEQFRPPQNVLNPGETLKVSFFSKGIPGLHHFWAWGWVRPTGSEEEIVAFAVYTLGDTRITNLDMIPDTFWALVPQDAGYRDAFQGRTISPYLPPTNPAVLCDTFILDLIGQVREAVAAGWIKHDLRKDDDNRGKSKGDDKGVKKGQDDDGDDHADDDVGMDEKDKNLPGVAKSIIKKLTKVRRECMRGKLGNAREKLRALIKQVNAQRGKHLTEEAYALIKFNAEFLLEKL